MAFGASALIAASTASFAQDEEDYILQITEVDVKLGHVAEFREAVKPYNECLVEADSDQSWGAWRNVGGEGITYHFVTDLANWAELDSPSEANQACWGEHGKTIMEHVSSMSTRYARPEEAWSGDAEGYSIVRLHEFRVDNNRRFRATVSEITSIMKEAEYEHLGSWFNVIGNSSNEADYFVVAHYDNFAAMDEDRPGAYGVVGEAVGAARRDALWDQFGDSLKDDWEYFTVLLRRDEGLSYSSDD